MGQRYRKIVRVADPASIRVVRYGKAIIGFDSFTLKREQYLLKPFRVLNEYRGTDVIC